MEKEHFANPEEKMKAVEIYFEEDTTRPPFSYAPRHARFERADETKVFEMEKRIYQCLELGEECFPELPDGTAETHPLHMAHTLLVGAYRELNNTVDDIKILMSGTTMQGHPLVKKMLNNHYVAKKFYFESLLGYLSIYQRTFGTEKEDRSKAAKLYHEAETIYIANQTYLGVRSCTHIHNPLREDGDTTMKHVYEVSVATMNFYIQKIEREPNKRKRSKLYRRMKEGVAVSLMHDLIEDHSHMSSDNLYGKISSLCEPDIRIGGLMSDPSLEGGRTTRRLNFFDGKSKASIKRKLNALIKPDNKKEKEGYLTRHLLLGEAPKAKLKRLIDKLDTIIIKIFDRGSNLQSLRFMGRKPNETKEARQNRKIEETQELFHIVNKIHKLCDDKDLIAEVIHLCHFCLQESERIESEYSSEVETQQLHTRIQATRTIIRAELLSATKKAA